MVNAEDYDAWLRLAESGKHFTFLNDILGDIWVHDSNLSGAIRKSTDNLRYVISTSYQRIYPQPGWSQRWAFRRAWAQTYFIEGRNWQQRGDYIQTLRCYLRAIITFPFISKVYLFTGVALLRLEKVLEKVNIYTIKS